MSETTLKEKIHSLLDKNALLLPMQICKLLGLPYKYKCLQCKTTRLNAKDKCRVCGTSEAEKGYWSYVAKVRSKWKHDLEDERGLKPSSFKNWRGWIYVDKLLNRKRDPSVVRAAVDAGWILTRSKNHYLLWKSKHGRLEWHVTGRVKVWVKKPASQGKAFQMLCDAFFATGLIFDIRLLEPFLKSLRFKGATVIIETGQRLPYLKIDFLKESNGFIFKAGDRSHPHAYELNFWYPDWGEQAEQTIARLTKLLEDLQQPRQPTLGNGTLSNVDPSQYIA